MENSKRRVVGIKTESIQGTPATLATTSYILADVEFPESPPEILERDYMRASLDPLPYAVGKRTAAVKIKTEFMGSGTPGIAYSPLGAGLLMAGMAVSGDANTLTYTPISTLQTNFVTPGQTATVEIFLGGRKHIHAGSVANVKISAEVNKLPMFELDTKGLYAAPTTTAFPTTSYLAQIATAWQNSTILIHGYAAIVKKWDIDFGNIMVCTDDPGAGKNGVGSWVITGRKPKVNIQIEQSLLATFNPFTLAGAGTQAACSWTVGTGSGKLITFTMPKVQIGDFKESELNGILCYDIPLFPAMNTGDDWISIVIT